MKKYMQKNEIPTSSYNHSGRYSSLSGAKQNKYYLRENSVDFRCGRRATAVTQNLFPLRR